MQEQIAKRQIWIDEPRSDASRCAIGSASAALSLGASARHAGAADGPYLRWRAQQWTFHEVLDLELTEKSARRTGMNDKKQAFPSFANMPSCIRTTVFLSIATVMTLLAGCSTPMHEPGKPVNFGVVSEGVISIYRGGEPVDEQEWQFIKDSKIKTIVKLNQYSKAVSESEEDHLAEKYGIKVIKVFMGPEDCILGKHCNIDLDEMPDPNLVEKAINEITAAAGNGPVYVHCSHGQDRTGLVVALYRMRVQGYCRKKADDERKHYRPNMMLTGITKELDQEKESSTCEH
ncbi:tyrosine-protein phosphatase [Ralstonia pseudosolanacearum]|uniref:phosphatase domain-containing putative toxin n=2 Tax=Ralstonia pseudosolanacearum TaxID=1310165 RepID=UPI003CF0DC3C